MGHQNLEVDLLRLLVAEVWLAISMKASHELYGRSYFSLGVGERVALDHMLAAMVGATYSDITPALLRPQPRRIAGFRADPT